MICVAFVFFQMLPKLHLILTHLHSLSTQPPCSGSLLSLPAQPPYWEEGIKSKVKMAIRSKNNKI